MAYFCTLTGARIAKPGVSKSVDSVNGHEEVIEVDGVDVLASKAKVAKGPEPEPEPKPEPKHAAKSVDPAAKHK